MHMKGILLLTSFLVFFCYSAYAQPQTTKILLSVKSETDNLLKNATVVIKTLQNKSLTKGFTDSSGNFYYTLYLEDKNVLLEISHISYFPFFKNISLSGNSYMETIILKEDVLNLNGVTVLSKKPFITMQPDRYVINIDGKNAVGNTAADILKKSPGITIMNDQVYLEGKPVLLQVNGKTIPVDGKDLLNYLSTNSSSGLNQIELITTPPANLDASFSGGVINLILLKSKKAGLNGNISSDIGFRSTYPLADLDLNLNYRKGKFNIYSNIGSYTGKNISESKNFRYFNTAPGTKTINEASSGYTSPQGIHYSAGIDFTLNKKTITGLLLTGFYDAIINTINNESSIFNNNKLDSIQTFYFKNEKINSLNVLNYNIKTQLDSTGQELNFDFDYSFINSKNTGKQDYQYLNIDRTEYRSGSSLNQETKTDPHLLGFKLDYKKKYKPFSLETGIKYAYSKINYQLDENRITVNPFSKELISDTFNYNENIYAAYFSLSGKYKLVDFRLGLRTEATKISGFSYSLNQRISNSYINFFPVVSLSQKIDTKNSLSVSFRRSITRPRFNQLNPFKYFLSPFAYYTGNPDLKPYFPYSIRLGYSYDNKIQTSVSYSYSKNRITEISSIENNTGITRSIKENNGVSKNLFLSFSYYNNITGWWYTNNTINAGYSDFHFFATGNKIILANTMFSISSTQRFTIKEKTSIELYTYFNSGAYFDVSYTKPFWFMDLSMSREIFKGDGEISLKMEDIFYSNITRTLTKFNNVNYTTRSKWDSRSFMVAFFYKFGKKNIQDNRQRNNTATTEERGRTN